MTERGRRRLDPMVLVRGLPGHPLHPPLTDATIGMYVLAGGLAVIGYAGAIKIAAGKGMGLALIGGLIVSVPTALTGLVDWLSIEWGSARWKTATLHLAAMVSAVALFALAVWRQYHGYQHGGVTAAGLVLTLCGVGVLSVGGWLGGVLVFVHATRVCSAPKRRAIRHGRASCCRQKNVKPRVDGGCDRVKWAALILWVITALGGFGLLGIWLQRGGLKQAGQPGQRIRSPLIFTHMLLAATGLVLWIIYLASGTRGFAWVAFALLLVVASLGFGMLALWLQRRQTTAPARAAGRPAVEGGLPAEQFPIALVGGHGVVAPTTLVLVLLAALKVGRS